jgi:hypothetical protein
VVQPDDLQREWLQQIHALSGGASNAFLVDATNPKDAIDASLSVLRGSHSAGKATPVNMPNAARGSYWLVGYLGLGPSEPLSWELKGATVDGSTIRITYQQPKVTMATRDVWYFYYWVPLGKLKPGTYRLELYDATRNATTLTRQVEVPPAARN